MKSKLTPKQIAVILQISLATVSRMTASGLLPAILVSVGRRKKIYRYDEDEIQKWMTERSHGGTGRKAARRSEVRNGDWMATKKTAFAQHIEIESKNPNGHQPERLVNGS
jgi:excisionase family DNA binding protein